MEQSKEERKRELDRISSAKYRERHREKIKERMRDYASSHYALNKDKKCEYMREYYNRNKQDRLTKGGTWRTKNPHKIAEYSIIRKLARTQAIPNWFEAEKVALLYRKCVELNALWGLEGSSSLTVDHVIPLVSDTVCGLHCWANLQLLCSADNSSKSNNYSSDW